MNSILFSNWFYNLIFHVLKLFMISFSSICACLRYIDHSLDRAFVLVDRLYQLPDPEVCNNNITQWIDVQAEVLEWVHLNACKEGLYVNLSFGLLASVNARISIFLIFLCVECGVLIVKLSFFYWDFKNSFLATTCVNCSLKC